MAKTKKLLKKSPARKSRSAGKKATRKNTRPDEPALFHLNLEVGDLERAVQFYATLFGLGGQRHAGSRFYLRCGAVTLQVVDVSAGAKPHPAAKALYFTVRDLDAVFERARALKCLSEEEVHGEPGGAISVRPWGERSFYAQDPWKNPLCFVEAGTTYG